MTPDDLHALLAEVREALLEAQRLVGMCDCHKDDAELRQRRAWNADAESLLPRLLALAEREGLVETISLEAPKRCDAAATVSDRAVYICIRCGWESRPIARGESVAHQCKESAATEPSSATPPEIQRAVDAEREACARIADACVEPPGGVVDTGKIWRNGMALTIADRIRAPRPSRPAPGGTERDRG